MTRLLFSIPISTRKLFMIIYLGAIAYASLASPSRIPRVILFEHLDKVVHFIMYFGFCIVAVYAFDKRIYFKDTNKLNIPISLYVLVVMMALVWGFGMELLQRYMSMGRQYSMHDMIANAAGALAGIVLYYLLFRRV